MEPEIKLNGEEVANLPEVTLNGQRVVMAPEVKEIYELINMANIAKMRKLEESKVARSSRFIQLNATPAIQEAQFAEPVISMSIVNRGPGSFNFRVNDGGHLADDPPLLINETANVNFEYPTIYTLYYFSPTAANVDILIKTGKKWLDKKN
jgi:hypothetical protein